MIHLFREMRILRQEEKLHKKLLTQIRIQSIISLILAGIVCFNIIFRDTDPLVAAALAGIGFILGLYVFSKMNVIAWNEEAELVQAEKMNVLGYATLGLYICFEIGLRTFLKDFAVASVTPFLLAGIFGTLSGRVIGLTVEIHRVFEQTHPKS